MFDLNAYLQARRERVDRELDARLPPEDTPPALLHRAMRYGVLSGGKRLRPILCMAAAEAVGGSADDALLPALAVEVLHAYTLVHDDLPCVDDDAFRRGRPTCHKMFGEANALLTGDALLALAFEWLAASPPPRNYPATQLVAELAAAAGSRGVVGGQVEDLAAAGQGADAARVAFIHRHKTADLFRAAVRMGGLAGGATAGQLECLSVYGVNVGLAFQISDDLLDASAGDPQELTCLSVYTPAEARARAEALIEKAVGALRALPGPVEPLEAIARFVTVRVE